MTFNDTPSAPISLSPIKEIESLCAKFPGSISLAQGIPNFPFAEELLAAVSGMLRETLTHRYAPPPGLPELREALAVTEGVKGILPDNVLVTAGAIEGITATLLALTSAGDEIIIPTPTYVAFPRAIAAARCVPVSYELSDSNAYGLEIEKLESLITPRTRMIFFANPQNPTGAVWDESTIAALADLAERRNLLLISDETYRDFVFSDRRCPTPLEFPAGAERTIQILSFSKTYGITGWRLGAIIGSKEIINRINPVHDTCVTCAPVISQRFGIELLKRKKQLVGENRALLMERRQLAYGLLAGLSEFWNFTMPDAAYYFFPRLLKYRDCTSLAHKLVAEAKVGVVPGAGFGPGGDGHLRISVAGSPEQVTAGCSRIRDFFLKS